MKRPYTDKQGQYLAFIYYYGKIHGPPPSESEMQQYFQVSPPSVHQNDLDARNSWPYRANTGPGSIHPSADSARRAAELDLARPSGQLKCPCGRLRIRRIRNQI